MAMKDLSKLSEEDLVDLNNELSEKRAKAAAEIKEQQLEVNSELSRRALRRKLQGLTSEELSELGEMIKENQQDG